MSTRIRIWLIAAGLATIEAITQGTAKKYIAAIGIPEMQFVFATTFIGASLAAQNRTYSVVLGMDFISKFNLVVDFNSRIVKLTGR